LKGENEMRKETIRKGVGIFMLAGFILLASAGESFSQGTLKGYTLSVRVLDTKKTYCTGQQSGVSGASVRIRPNIRNAVWRYGSTDSAGRVQFTNVMGGVSYTISVDRNIEGVGSLCDSKTTTYSMPNQNAGTTVALDNCWTTSSYDISARFLGSGTDTVTAGKSYTLSFVVKNNGANGPSKPRNVTLVRYYGTEGGSPVIVGSAKSVPSLCVNEEIGFDVTDTQLSSGFWIYTLKWESNPDQGVTNTNHLPTKTITVKSQ
jgi:hypothetical protein